MSGHSDNATCPNCKGEMFTYNDYKPFEYSSCVCFECGFYTETSVKYYSLEEVNTERLHQGLEELEKLPKQEFTY